MKKILKLFFVTIIMAILPISFSACNKNQAAINSNTSNESTGENGGEEEQAIAYVIDDSEMNSILLSSSSNFETLIQNLNESELLKNKDYQASNGTVTNSILKYVYYPTLFKSKTIGDKKCGTITFDKVYAYALNNEGKYFVVSKDDNKKEIDVRFVTNNSSGNYGGGISNIGTANISISNCTITNNTARASSGGIFNSLSPNVEEIH